MLLQEVRNKLFASDEFVLHEVRRLQRLYGLKREIRWASERREEVQTESVAEHVYGMFIVASYFMPLETGTRDWDRALIYDMITWHDIDEVETGDTLGFLKTDDERAGEANAALQVVSRAPAALQRHATAAVEVYGAQSTDEARFVKAIDKIESTIEAFCENGRAVYRRNGTTFENHRSCKDKYFTDFPIIARVNEVLTNEMRRAGFFVDGVAKSERRSVSKVE